MIQQPAFWEIDTVTSKQVNLYTIWTIQMQLIDL